jgi:hypothetical protein
MFIKYTVTPDGTTGIKTTKEGLIATFQSASLKEIGIKTFRNR